MCCPTMASHAVWLSFCHSNCLSFDTHSMCCELTQSGCLVTQSASLPYLNQSVARSSSHAVWLFRCHAICLSIRQTVKYAGRHTVAANGWLRTSRLRLRLRSTPECNKEAGGSSNRFRWRAGVGTCKINTCIVMCKLPNRFET